MSRRTWTVLLIVVAVLAITPHLPEWWPALVGAIRDFNLAAVERSTLAFGAHAITLLNDGIAYTRARPQLVLGASAGMVLALVVVGVRHLVRRRGTASAVGTPAITIMPADLPQPLIAVPVAAPARATYHQERAALAPTTLRIAAPSVTSSRRSAAPGRGTMVRRLSAAGHSTAEIARATHVGQDAVRLVLLRQVLM